MRALIAAGVIFLLLQLSMLSMSQKLVVHEDPMDEFEPMASNDVKDSMHQPEPQNAPSSQKKATLKPTTSSTSLVTTPQDTSKDKASSTEVTTEPQVAATRPTGGPSNPLTAMLEVAVNNIADKNALHERAEAIRRGEADPTPVDPAILEALFPDPVKAMRRLLDVIEDDSQTPHDIAANLYALEDYVQDIDNANDLYKIGGVDIVVSRLSHTDPTITKNAAWVLGTLVQSNPKPQEQALTAGAMPPLVQLLASSQPVESRAKALYATSALIRSFAPALESFYSLKGIHVLVDCLKEAHVAAVMEKKVATMISDILVDRPSLATDFDDAGVVPLLVPMLASANKTVVQEKLLEALVGLGGSSDACVNSMREASLPEVLIELRHNADAAILAEPDSADMYETIFAHITSLDGMLSDR